MKIGFVSHGDIGNIYTCLAVAEQFDSERKWNFEKFIAGDYSFTDNQFDESEEKIIQEIKKIKSNEENASKNKFELYYIGNKRSIEEKILSRLPIIKFLSMPKIDKPKVTDSIFEFITIYLACIFKLYKYSLLAVKYLRENQIDLIYAVASYQAVPTLMACVMLNKKFIIHNLDSNYSLTTKVFSFFANKVTFGFPMGPDTSKNIYTGNPVLKSFVIKDSNENSLEDIRMRRQKYQKAAEINILIYGGENGKARLNDLIGDILPKLASISSELATQKNTHLKVTHITGQLYYEEHISYYLHNNNYKYGFYRVYSASRELGKLFQDADICICNSSAANISALCVTKTAAILVPRTTSKTEKANADAFEDASSAYQVRQYEGNKEKQKNRLLYYIETLAFDPITLEQRKKNIAELAEHNSSLKIFNLLQEI